MEYVKTHRCLVDLPARSILWLDEHASMVCPELLFVQMACELTLPSLVMLGLELCGSFTRSAVNPMEGPVFDHVPPATTVEEIRSYLGSIERVRGLKKARRALLYMYDGAASVPEAVLAVVYGLPMEECGYGMGPITINRPQHVSKTQDPNVQRVRIPDILFPFAPIGINYDGEADHLDLRGLVAVACAAEHATDEDAMRARADLETKLHAVRAKAVDDMRRNREFLAKGCIILPMTKEDLYGFGNLDNFTRQLLACAHNFYGIDTKRYEAALDNKDLCWSRYAMMCALFSAPNVV